jgi:uncharacterized protein YacL
MQSEAMQASNDSTIVKTEVKTVLVLWLSLGLTGMLCGVAVSVALAISPKAAPFVVALSLFVAIGISLTAVLPKETTRAWYRFISPSAAYLREVPDSLRMSGRPEEQRTKNVKILDSSVILDGRIADIAETGFMDDILIIPEFVLRELEKIAQSSESTKRGRGLRGLETLRRLKSSTMVYREEVKDIVSPGSELISLAKLYGAKIISNDFVLHKIAQGQGVKVVNINELADALKPIVLPGETMRVFILKEGREQGQGVAYLDDGTMVVVDNASTSIGKNVEIDLTSVLQTTAGKLIFGRLHKDVSGKEHISIKPKIYSTDVPSSRPLFEDDSGAENDPRIPRDKQ